MMIKFLNSETGELIGPHCLCRVLYGFSIKQSNWVHIDWCYADLWNLFKI